MSAHNYDPTKADYPIVGVVQFSIFDTAKMLWLKGMTIQEVIQELQNKLGILPADMVEKIREEAQRW